MERTCGILRSTAWCYPHLRSKKNFVLYFTKYKVALHRWNVVVFVATHTYCGVLLFNWNIVCSWDLCFEGWRFILCYYMSNFQLPNILSILKKSHCDVTDVTVMPTNYQSAKISCIQTKNQQEVQSMDNTANLVLQLTTSLITQQPGSESSRSNSICATCSTMTNCKTLCLQYSEHGNWVHTFSRVVLSLPRNQVCPMTS